MIDHEDIPGLMKANTMAFETAGPRIGCGARGAGA